MTKSIVSVVEKSTVETFATDVFAFRGYDPEKSDAEFFLSMSEQDQASFKFNLALNYLNYQLADGRDYGQPSLDDLALLMKWATEFFKLFPERSIENDIESAYSGWCGSPWQNQCKTPGSFVISATCSFLETDEKTVDEYDWAVVRSYLDNLIEIGVTPDDIYLEADFIARDNEELNRAIACFALDEGASIQRIENQQPCTGEMFGIKCYEGCCDGEQ